MKLSAHSASAPSFLTRVKGLAQRNPWAPWSLLHYEFQNNLGFDLNRRLYPEKSFLPSYVSLSPTRRCNLKCKMCIQHRNSKDRPENRGLTLVPPSIPAGEFYESEIGPEDLPLLQDGLLDIQRRAQDRIKVQFSPNLPVNLVAPYYMDLEYPFPQVCKSLWKTCRILPDGTISPCLHLVMGKTTKEPLSVIWNNSRMRRWRKFISKRLLPGCVRCCHRSFA